MHIFENVPLAIYSTMRLGGRARYLTDINAKSEIDEAVRWAEQRKLPIIMIGEGSNIIWSDEGFSGLVLVNKITGFETFTPDSENMYATAGSGEHWDTVVKRCVELGYSGIEQLSLIPGTAGATPVQNVGAYGREISDVLVSVEAYDRNEHRLINLPKVDCQFGYRTSRFKKQDKYRYFITAITLHLNKRPPAPPFYDALQSYLTQQQIKDYTATTIREAVIAIRESKLPNPAKIPNNGSFFANPVIAENQMPSLLARYPHISYWQLPDKQIKLSAAWLIQEAGFKGVSDKETGMATWPKHSLVLINEHATRTADLIKFRQKITEKVFEMFAVKLEQEPEIITTPPAP